MIGIGELVGTDKGFKVYSALLFELFFEQFFNIGACLS